MRPLRSQDAQRRGLRSLLPFQPGARDRSLPSHQLDVHDVLNVFQVTGLTADDRYFVKASPAKKGDFIEFFAEIDVLCAISTCPHGDLSVQMWGEEAGDPLSTCGPLGVEIWQPDPAP